MSVVFYIFLIIIIFGLVLYFIYYNKKEKRPEISGQTKVPKECSLKFNVSNYDIDNTPIKGSVIKENFELSPTTITDKTLLDEEGIYKRGILKDEISNTIYPSINHGSDCLEYPEEIYIPAGYCDIYNDNSMNVSQSCYRELWKNAGCRGDPFLIPGKQKWNVSQPYSSLVGDVNAWYYYAKVLKNPYHAQYCL